MINNEKQQPLQLRAAKPAPAATTAAAAGHPEARLGAGGATDTVYIKDIQYGMKNLTLTCIVLEVGPPTLLKECHEVRTVKVADQTACINLSVWDDLGHVIGPSDILRLTKVYASAHRSYLTLYTAKMGTVEKVGEFCMVYNDQLNMSEVAIAAAPPPLPGAAAPPNGGNGGNGGGGAAAETAAAAAAPNSNAGGYGSRNAAASATNSHAGSSSRYHDLPARNNPRNGQPNEAAAGANPRSRGERR